MKKKVSVRYNMIKKQNAIEKKGSGNEMNEGMYEWQREKKKDER